jgi:hypothetical protein
MSAKKNLCSFRLATKFSAIYLILKWVSENSALECVDWACFDLITRLVSKNFARKRISFSHFNFCLSLSRAFLDCRCRLLLGSKNIWILIRCASHLTCKWPLSENLLVIGKFLFRLGLLLKCEVTFECISITMTFNFLSSLSGIVSYDIGVVFTLLEFPCFSHSLNKILSLRSWGFGVLGSNT